MNIQAMMKQAQKMQKDLMNKQAEIDKMEFKNKTRICNSENEWKKKK